MLSNELLKEITAKFGNDSELRNFIAARDVQAIVAKCKEAGFDVTEGDVAEAVINSGSISDDELNCVAGGCCFGNAGPYGCGPQSCHADNR